MITVVIIESIFRPRRSRRTAYVYPDESGVCTVSRALEQAAGEAAHVGTWHVLKGGRPMQPADRVRDREELIAMRLPQGPVVPIVTAAIVSTLVGVGLSLLIGFLVGTPKKPRGGDDSPTYGFDGIQNTLTQGRPIQRWYGEHRVGGQFLALFRRCADATSASTSQQLYVIIGLGSGPLTAIGQYTTDQDGLTPIDDPAPSLPEGLHLGGNEANTYHGITGSIRMGSAGQAAPPSALGFDNVVQRYPLDVTLTDQWQYYELHQTVSGLHLNVFFPAGLFKQNTHDGDIDPWAVEYLIEAQIVPNGAFIDITPFVVAGGLSMTHNKTTAFYRTIFIEDLDFGASGSQLFAGAQLRIRRTAAEVASSFIQDRVILQDVNEVLVETMPTHPGIGLIALRIEATDQLSGGIPVATTMVKGVAVPVWKPALDGDPESGPLLVRQYSDNAAWIALDILLDRTDGLGNEVKPDAELVRSALAWASWNDQILTYAQKQRPPLFTTRQTESIVAGAGSIVLTGDEGQYPAGVYVEIEMEGENQVVSATDLGGGRTQLDLVLPSLQAYPAGYALHRIQLTPTSSRRRHTCNIGFDADGSAWEALLAVCRTARAMPIIAGQSIRFRFEDAGEPVQHFDDSVFADGTLRIDYIGGAERADVVEVAFLDAAKDYDRSLESAGDPFPELDRVPVTRTIELFGITNAAEARTEAFYHERAGRLVRKKLVGAVPLIAVACEPGDIISVASTLPAWSEVVSRASGTLASFTLDHEVTFLAGLTYGAVLRTGGDPGPRSLAVTSGPGTYAPGDAITTDGPGLVITDAPCALGVFGQITRHWRLLSTALDPDLLMHLSAVQYVPEIYRLAGWFLPMVQPAPDPEECIEPGTYFIPLAGACDACPLPGAACPDAYWVVDEVLVDVTGDAADCVSIDQIGDNGVVFTVTGGCSGEFCITITVTCALVTCFDTPGGLYCCTAPPEGWPECAPLVIETCFTVC